MRAKTLSYLLAVALLCSPVCGGCGGVASSDRPATYPVAGTITRNGQPLEGATVKFQLVDGSRSAVGTTDAEGRYQLTTFTADDGAVPGDYRVTVTKYDLPAGAPSPAAVVDDPNAPVVELENQLPSRYANAETSGLAATVTEGENTFDFQLEQ